MRLCEDGLWVWGYVWGKRMDGRKRAGVCDKPGPGIIFPGFKYCASQRLAFLSGKLHDDIRASPIACTLPKQRVVLATY